MTSYVNLVQKPAKILQKAGICGSEQFSDILMIQAPIHRPRCVYQQWCRTIVVFYSNCSHRIYRSICMSASQGTPQREIPVINTVHRVKKL